VSYLLIRVHSFECDFPGCSAEEEHAERLKTDAWAILRRSGWTARKDKHLCPKHGRQS